MPEKGPLHGCAKRTIWRKTIHPWWPMTWLHSTRWIFYCAPVAPHLSCSFTLHRIYALITDPRFNQRQITIFSIAAICCFFSLFYAFFFLSPSPFFYFIFLFTHCTSKYGPGGSWNFPTTGFWDSPPFLPGKFEDAYFYS